MAIKTARMRAAAGEWVPFAMLYPTPYPMDAMTSYKHGFAVRVIKVDGVWQPEIRIDRRRGWEFPNVLNAYRDPVGAKRAITLYAKRLAGR